MLSAADCVLGGGRDAARPAGLADARPQGHANGAL